MSRGPLVTIVLDDDEEVAPPVSTSVDYIMGGVPLVFPLKGYKSQVAIMSKIITTAQKQNNCLLESPTGSGKTLALLCGALAWQAKESAAVRQIQMEAAAAFTQLHLEPEEDQEMCAFCTSKTTCAPPAVQQEFAVQTADIVPPVPDDSFSDDEDFKPRKKKRKGVVYLPIKQPQVAIGTEKWAQEENATEKLDTVKSCTCQDSCVAKFNNVGMWNDQGWDDEQEPDGVPKVPKIFYGTRTHKQIEQVVRELKKTHYKSVKMSILASREHMCIHPKGSYSSCTEMCHELLDPRSGPGCSFKTNVDRIGTHSALSNLQCPQPFDIEDLVTVGRAVKACPYFASRSLMERGAELIFCPYNYLIDPQIRDSMQLNLKNSVIILDEGHNIEDVARESASFTLQRDDLKKAAEDCKVVAIQDRLRDQHNIMKKYLEEIDAWIVGQDKDLKSTGDYTSMSLTLSGIEAIAIFENAGIGQQQFYIFKSAVDMAIADMSDTKPNDTKNKSEATKPVMHATTRVLCSGLCSVLLNLYSNEMAYAQDYHIAVVKTLERRPFRASRNGWNDLGEQSSNQEKTEWQYTLHFWCMNPAVAMASLAKAARSIILTSGTLSPMDSFSSELGLDFTMKFEADHVIDSDQVFVRSISHGPQGGSLNGQYKNTQTFEYQDELGRVVLAICRTVKHGLLAFFPSYKLLENVTNRWQNTGLWAELEKYKNVLSEPRKGGDMDDVMYDFNKSIEDPAYLGRRFVIRPNQPSYASRTGAILLAVYRGKVSEGMDFANNQARAVIAIGIPYPAFTDTRVQMKRAYNDKHAKTRGLLTGSRWYDIQAYRALNQALGRCIRHRKDWGAILLVDDRFSRGAYYTSGLSKWLRRELGHSGRCDELIADLQQFMQERTAVDDLDQQIIDAA